MKAARFGFQGSASVPSIPPHSQELESRPSEKNGGEGSDPVDSAGKLRFIEGMRGAAALYVALGHLCTMVDPAHMVGFEDKSPELMKRFVACFGYGHLAVAIFIVISGFSLQLSLFTNGNGTMRSVSRFYNRRARRILPTYYASLAASLAVAWFLTPLLVARYQSPFSMYLPVNSTTFWTHVFLVHNWSPAWMYKINGVFWSIAIEVQLYVVFPVLVKGMNRIGRLAVLALAIAAALIVLNYAAQAPKLYPWFLPLFVTGMVAANFAYRPHLRIGLMPGFALALSTLLIGLGAWSCSQGVNLPLQDGLFGAGAACAMYAMAVQPMHVLARGFRMRWLTFIGGFSYTLYLMHHPIEQVMFWVKPESISGPQSVAYQFLVSLPIVILGTWLFSLAFERPFLSKPPRAAVVEVADVGVPAFLAHQPEPVEEPMDFPRLPALGAVDGGD